MSSRRVPSDGAKEAARHQPGGWVYEIDPWFDADGPVPPYGIVGAWQVDDAGIIVGDFRVNENYRPSPAAHGFRHPLSPLEDVMQRSAAGYADDEALVAALDDARVWVVQVPGHDGALSIVDSSSGPVVDAYSTPDLVGNGPAGPVDSAPIAFGVLRAMLPDGVRIALNPGTPPSLVLPK